MYSKYRNEFLYFIKDRVFVFAMTLSALMAYGYQLTHSTLGTDDICIDYYFSDGLGVTIGRWPFFVLSNWFGIDGISRYIPFLADFLAVLILMAGALTWLVFIKVVAQNSGIILRKKDYIIFGCFFSSYSLISQVWIYYLHNGIAIGYLLIGTALLIIMDDFLLSYDYKSIFNNVLWPAVLVCIASSFYESMMAVFLFGVGIYLMLYYYRDVKVNYKQIGYVFAKSVMVLGIAFVFRYIIIKVLTYAYRFTPGSRQPRPSAVAYFFENLREIVSGTICDYLLLPEYQPIFLFMLCYLFGVLFLVADAVKRKRFRLIVISLITFLAMFSITPFMNQVLPYRTMQVIAIFVAFVMLVFVHKLCHEIDFHRAKSVINLIPYVIVIVLLWNNYCEINYDFYMEFENNEYCMRKIEEIGHDLVQMGYDNSSDRVLFVSAGKDSMPYPSEQDMIVEGSIWDSLRDGICKLFGTDNHVVDGKYYQTVSNDVTAWALDAFGNQNQMANLLLRKGYRISLCEDEVQDVITEDEINRMPEYPENGFITKIGDVFVVKVK